MSTVKIDTVSWRFTIKSLPDTPHDPQSIAGDIEMSHGDFGENLAANIYKARRKLNMNKVEFARYLGISRQALHNYEAALQLPSAYMLYRLHTTANIDLNWLLSTPARSPQPKARSIT